MFSSEIGAFLILGNFYAQFPRGLLSDLENAGPDLCSAFIDCVQWV